MRQSIADFFEIVAGVMFDVPPQEAVDYFRAKGLRPTFAWQDMLGEEHATAFTVAKMLDMDMLLDVQKSLDIALATGQTFADWADNLVPMLQAKGWWGRKEMTDPLTGKTIMAQLGSPWRLETIFRTNLQTAYSAGQWQQIMEQAEIAPYLMYDAVDDFRTREQHRAWDNKVLPIADKFWRAHYPPNGYNCRCGVIQLSDDDLEEMGLKVDPSPRIKYGPWTNPRTGITKQVPEGIDPGFDYNPGKARHEHLQKLAQEKAGTIEGELGKAAKEGLAEAARQAEATTPARSKKKYELLAELEARALEVAETADIFLGVDVDGAHELLAAIEIVNIRFNLGKLAHIGDIHENVHGVPKTTVAAYLSEYDALFFRPEAVDFSATSKLQKVFDMPDNQIPWAAVASILRGAPYANEFSARIAEALPSGRPWTFRYSPSATALHEMGHRLHAKNRRELDGILAAGFNAGWQMLVSEYGAKNHREFMAEAFTIYMSGTPEDWRRIYPPLLAWFKRYDRRM